MMVHLLALGAALGLGSVALAQPLLVALPLSAVRRQSENQIAELEVGSNAISMTWTAP